MSRPPNRRVQPATAAVVVRVDPGEHDIEVRAGESLIEAAWRAGYQWPTLCYGMGTCTACQCEVLDGLDNLSPRTEAEEHMLGDLGRRKRRANPRRVRLACQLFLTGDATIRKPGVRVTENVESTTATTEAGSQVPTDKESRR
ncbi:2Fe-2S iron-sulfur cluster-binding protein [Williamsia sp. DF01-3]|uniref:2Fe-2S iron-sulfur cluster-binding protein n=1 Tax=Williamsia sp. DF01-3 TaxID=2934157 RepID=UPI001FF497F3|nr:2Fe-2S iron-sulfur cluster-binding protein [Williamsia sp. DF01-3]MCK0516702.1 (2Fe-2S)-binding protein [Williamsia sp. DF01-3]